MISPIEYGDDGGWYVTVTKVVIVAAPADLTVLVDGTETGAAVVAGCRTGTTWLHPA